MSTATITRNASVVSPLVAKPQPAIVNITPDTAKRWLQGNTVNRNLREAQVAKYARDMAAGRWTFSNDAICFSPGGQLLNGQHRLNAIIRSGASLPMLVLRGVNPDAVGNMDSGVGRTAADQLGYQGESHKHLLAAALKFAVVYSDGRIYQDRKVQAVSRGEMDDFLAANPDIRESVAFVSAHTRSIDMTPTAKAVAHWVFSRAAGTAAASEFFLLLNGRAGLDEGSPILALDSRLRELRRNRTRTTHRDELYMAVKSWNYFRQGRRVRTIALRAKNGDGRIPTVIR